MDAGRSVALGSVCKTGTTTPALSQGHRGACHLVSDITLCNHQTHQVQEQEQGLRCRPGTAATSPRLSWAQLGGHGPMATLPSQPLLFPS